MITNKLRGATLRRLVVGLHVLADVDRGAAGSGYDCRQLLVSAVVSRAAMASRIQVALLLRQLLVLLPAGLVAELVGA